MKFHLLAAPGEAAEAVLVTDVTGEQDTLAKRIARTLTAPRGSHSIALSRAWSCVVVCMPEFEAWWLRQPAESRPVTQIVLHLMVP